jgi:hypothetical protein
VDQSLKPGRLVEPFQTSQISLRFSAGFSPLLVDNFDPMLEDFEREVAGNSSLHYYESQLLREVGAVPSAKENRKLISDFGDEPQPINRKEQL